MRVRVWSLLLVFLIASVFGRDADAQHFGRNKVEYQNFDFRILETEHFAVYHYQGEEQAARIAARFAERWYGRLSRVLGHQLDGRQPLILYGSQPEFAQTNVVSSMLGDGIGGVTDSARRRIVMPFAPTLGETDRILGHELTHAFQFDMARRYRGGTAWPLWTIEGLAQYLSLGPSDGETAMWLRDAVRSDLLPQRQSEAARRFSPYRYGHAMWAYLAGRFGDRVIAEILKAKEAGTFERRVKAVTGLDLETLFGDWRQASNGQYQDAPDRSNGGSSPLFADAKTGRLYLGPALSPDGRRVVFFSEKDRLSLDLFLADTVKGTIIRKLATTAASARLENLQAVRSSGSWSPEGDRFVFAAVKSGRPALVLVDVDSPRRQQEIPFRQFGQIFTPSWSPDGRAIAFTAFRGGVTDLYVYDISSQSLNQITDDVYADLQPEWGPDGRSMAFVTDRYSSDADAWKFGQTELALVDIRTKAVRKLAGVNTSRQLNPQWSADGGSIYFVSDSGRAPNVFRLDLNSGDIYQVSDVPGGVSGLTPTSPALSVARSAAVLAFTSFQKGRYHVEIQRGASEVGGLQSETAAPTLDVNLLPPSYRQADSVQHALANTDVERGPSAVVGERVYSPRMFLEAVGPPHVSTGGGPFGTFVRAGGSFLFSDLLGERKFALFAQAGNRLRDLAIRAQYLNRERRWNWGAFAEVQPSLRRLPRVTTDGATIDPAVTRETHYFERTQFRAAGIVAYPFDQARRLEFEGGMGHTSYRRSVSAVVRSLTDGRLLSRSISESFGGEPATVGEASVAFVNDTAVFGPTSPILGGRSRLEVASTFGELSATRVLLDYRRYVMPVRPYTLAFRGLHLGQYGPDADDPRLLPTFLGSRQFLRGYGWGSIQCRPNGDGACEGYDELLGSRLMVGNVELRVPLLGIRERDLRYGPIPLEGFLFADAGLVWSRTAEFSAARASRRLVRSFGMGARASMFGLPIEFAVVRAVDPPSHDWSFDLSFRAGF
jgi:Tol biopolymer transport system component